MLAGRVTGSVEALLVRQQGELAGEQEKDAQWVEGESTFGVHSRALLHSPWAL